MTFSFVILIFSFMTVSNEASDRTNKPLEYVFKAIPTYQICTEEQEENAFVCLLDLMGLIPHFESLKKKNIFVEMFNENSSLIEMCSVIETYDKCLFKEVFQLSDGKRCAFASALNKMARISLYSFCDPENQKLLRKNNWCMKKLDGLPATEVCSSKFAQLWSLMGEILERGSDRAVCATFYQMKDIFQCLYPIIREECGTEPLEDADRVLKQMTDLGVADGCPAVKPENFDQVVTMETTTQTTTTTTDAPVRQREPMVTPIECSQSEAEVVETCEEEHLTELADKVERLFENGLLQARHAGDDQLVDIFLLGCTLFTKFRQCFNEIPLSLSSTCQVSSCMLAAGEDVCSAEDVEAELRKHLSCVFSLIIHRKFSECIRETFTKNPGQDYTLQQLKRLIPQFAGCVENIVQEKCGPVPMKLLWAMGVSDKICFLDLTPPEAPETEPELEL